MHSITSGSKRTHRQPSLRILLVDDGVATSKAFRRLSDGVSTGEYVVDRATSPADGFKAIVADEHDVYVVDHHVGLRTGFDVLSRVKEAALRVPIVFVAGTSDHRTGVTAVGAGASCYVVEDSINSGLLELSLRHAVEQTRDLQRLSDVGITIDTGTSSHAHLLSTIARRVRDSAAVALNLARRSLESDLPAPALESFELIESKANTLLTLANDLSDLSLLEVGHLQFNSAPFSLRGLVSHVRQTIGPEARERGVEIVVDVAPDVPDTVVGDPGRLRRVILSLVEAVLERRPTDRIVLKVSVGDRSQGAIALQFEIEAAEDGSMLGGTRVTRPELTASGDMPAMQLDRGMLGMAVVLETVSHMGGRVTVDSEQSRAAVVQFTIRLEISEDEREPRPTIDVRTSMEGLILVIANAGSDRRSMMETLNEAELPYLVVPSVEAWAAATRVDDESVPPALALIESSGDTFAICDRFHAVAPSVPVVVIVPSGSRGDAARCREHGVKGYLARPMDPGDLVDVVRSVMVLAASGDTTTLVTRHWLREGRSSLRVLVVDDNSTSRFLLTRMLEQRGHSTTTASKGEEAVEAITQAPFDVVLMDVLMPGMDGLQTTRMIRDLQAGTDQLPLIIGLSAFADQDNIDRARKAGMDDLLSKPVRPDDLFAVVERKRKVELAHAG